MFFYDDRRFCITSEDIDVLEVSLSNLYLLWTFYRLFHIKFSCSWVHDNAYYSCDSGFDIFIMGLRQLYTQEDLQVIDEAVELEELDAPFDEDCRYGIIWRPKWFRKVWKKDRKRIKKWIIQANRRHNNIICLTKENDGICIAFTWVDFIHEPVNEFLLLLAKLEKRRKKHENRNRN